jgi:hypothetical protein
MRENKKQRDSRVKKRKRHRLKGRGIETLKDIQTKKQRDKFENET